MATCERLPHLVRCQIKNILYRGACIEGVTSRYYIIIRAQTQQLVAYAEQNKLFNTANTLYSQIRHLYSFNASA